MIRTMVAVQRTSARADGGEPVDALRLQRRGELLGLDVPSIDELFTDDGLDALVDAWTRAGVGAVARARGSRERATTLRQLVEASDASPLPEHSWPAMRELLGDDMLCELLHLSTSSLHRYARGERATPDDVAARLHSLVIVCADLLCGYNDFGVRRWFVRPRSRMDGGTVADLLPPGWDPDDADPARVREMAAAVLGSAAT